MYGTLTGGRESLTAPYIVLVVAGASCYHSLERSVPL